MNNMWVIFEREYLERVKKKTFLIATLLTPLIMPLIGGLAYFLGTLDSGEERIVYVVDESNMFSDGFEIDDYTIKMDGRPLDSAKNDLEKDRIFGVLYIPSFELSDPKGITFESKKSPEITFTNKFRNPIKNKIDSLKLIEFDIDPEVADKLKTSVSIERLSMGDDGKSKESNTELSFGLGYVMAFLMYMFVFIYGSFIMQSVLNEKTSKIVEVIVSSVKPFQLMLGKVLANAAVALTQFAIWIILMTVIVTFASSFIGYDPAAAQTEAVTSVAADAGIGNKEAQEMAVKVLDKIYSVPWFTVIGLFIFYFLGGFLLYGALFAAVGSAVDSLQEAQQFMLPITIPIIASIILMSVVLQNPEGIVAVVLTMIPFTSPVLMMARVAYGFVNDAFNWRISGYIMACRKNL